MIGGVGTPPRRGAKALTQVPITHRRVLTPIRAKARFFFARVEALCVQVMHKSP